MRLRDETCDIEKFEGDEARARLTGRVFRVAGTAQFFVRARLSYESDASVRLDRCERIVRDLDRRERRRSEESGLANVRFPDDSQLHGVSTEIALEVP